MKDLCYNLQLEGLKRAAQKLGGSGRSYGFPEVSDICERLEQEAEIRDWTEITNTVEELARVVQTL
jgi:HPt (histidine-containing phosphotransfer) domain-containing protein